eukprot:m.139970 g.139970  ORF g.139970 m.139970 type:complete len:693 (-) comp30093_c0_seq4:77-2155(-)
MEAPSDPSTLVPTQAVPLDAILKQLKQMEVGIANISDKLETLESRRTMDVHKMWDELRTLFVLIAESHIATYHVIVEKDNLSITKKSLQHFLELYFLVSDSPSLKITVDRMFASMLRTTVDDAANNPDFEITFDEFLRLKEVVTDIVPEVDVPYLRPKSGATEFQPSVFFGKQNKSCNVSSATAVTNRRFRSQSANASDYVVRHARISQVGKTALTGEKVKERYVWLWLWSDNDDKMLWGLLPTFYNPTPTEKTVHAILEAFSHAVTVASVVSYYYRLGDTNSVDEPEETWFTAIFMIEYIIRWIAVRPSHKVQRPYTKTGFFVAKIWHMLKFYALIDVICILPFWIELGVKQAGGPAVGAAPLRILRLFRLLKLGAHMVVRCRMLVELVMSMKARLLDLLVVLMVFGVWMLMLGTLVQIFEEHGDQAELFDTLPKCLWWATITATTVGYGDSYPVTNGGYIIGTICALSGAVIMSIPMVFILITFDEIHYLQAAKHKRAQDAADLFMEWIDRCVPKALAEKEGLQAPNKNNQVVRMMSLSKGVQIKMRQTMNSKRKQFEKLTRHRRKLRNALVKALATEDSTLILKMHKCASANQRHTLDKPHQDDDAIEQETHSNHDPTIVAPNNSIHPTLGKFESSVTSKFEDEDDVLQSSVDGSIRRSRWTRSRRVLSDNGTTEKVEDYHERTRVTSI